MFNRIIGIMVVLAIGVLVYPFLFHPHAGFSGQAEAIKAPPFPSPQAQNDTIRALDKHEKLVLNKPKASKLAASRQKRPNATIISSVEREDKHSKLSFNNPAWVIQVATFKDKVNALGLVNQLRSKGYNAFIRQSKAAFGEELQVYIGPEGKKDSAVLLASKLAKETKLTGVVKSYKLLSA